jgi:hypothetical protein
MYQLPDLLQKEIIVAIEADTVMFPAGWLVRLYTNNLIPTKANVIGDFTELTNVEVPGYAAVAGAWSGTPLRKQDGSWEDGGAGPLDYIASGAPPSPQIVYGWYATDAAKTTLIGSGAFPAPFTFTATGDGLSLEQLLNVLQLTDSTYQILLDMEEE